MLHCERSLRLNLDHTLERYILIHFGFNIGVLETVLLFGIHSNCLFVYKLLGFSGEGVGSGCSALHC